MSAWLREPLNSLRHLGKFGLHGLNLSCIVTILLLLSGCSEQKELNEATNWEQQSAWVEKGPLRARISLRHQSFSILDQQDMMLEVIAPADLDLSFPAFRERLEDLRLVPWRPDQRSVQDDGKVLIQKFVRFEMFESGPQSLPPFRVSYIAGAGDEAKSGHLDTPSLEFNIESIDDPNLIAAPIETIDSFIRPKPFPWHFLALCVALVIGLLWGIKTWLANIKAKKSAPPPPPEPAHLWAWRQLEALVAQQKQGELSNENIVNQLSLILRVYIEKRFDIHAPEQTTEEFLAQGLKTHGGLSTHAEVIEQFLEYADLIKFAGQSAKIEDVQQGFDFLKQFIEMTQEEIA